MLSKPIIQYANVKLIMRGLSFFLDNKLHFEFMKNQFFKDSIIITAKIMYICTSSSIFKA